MHLLKRIIPFVLIFLIIGCTDPILDLSLNEDEVAKIAHLQNPFDSRFKFSVDGNKSFSYIGVHDCDIYKATVTNDVVIAWGKVVYSIWPSKCVKHSIEKGEQSSSNYIVVTLQKIDAISNVTVACPPACGTITRYRTKDGVQWEQQKENGSWIKE